MDLLLLIGLLLFISGKILIQEYVLHLHCWIMNIDPEIQYLRCKISKSVEEGKYLNRMKGKILRGFLLEVNFLGFQRNIRCLPNMNIYPRVHKLFKLFLLFCNFNLPLFIIYSYFTFLICEFSFF